MSRPHVDITGQRFGRLTALSYVGWKATKRLWLCKCDCGNTTTTRYDSLVGGHTTSCGCYSRELSAKKVQGGWNKKSEGESAFNTLYLGMIHSAKSRKHRFELTKDEFRALTQSNCYYCGQPPSQVRQATRGTNGVYVYNGMDRIDSKRDYTIDNVRPCCKTCNFAKGTLTEEEFFQWVDRLIAHRTL